jgi:hypothetical protein
VALARFPPCSRVTATVWSRPTSPIVGLASPGWIFSRVAAFEVGAIASSLTHPMVGRRLRQDSRDHQKRCWEFLRHALALTATVQGQLALLVRLQWIAGQRVAGVMTATPFAGVGGADPSHPLV